MAAKVTPYLVVQGAAQALEFYKKVFGAVETMRLNEPGGGRIGHAEIKIGESEIMLADEFPEWGNRGPKTIGGTPVGLHLRVDDVDAMIARAVAEGATVTMEAADQFYGERSGKFNDPFGHEWMVSTKIEEVTVAEMQRRYDEMMKAAA